MTSRPRFILVDSKNRTEEFDDFVTAKQALDDRPGARFVKCSSCGSVLSQRSAPNPQATERLARTASSGHHGFTPSEE
jgi:hypothetical protein